LVFVSGAARPYSCEGGQKFINPETQCAFEDNRPPITIWVASGLGGRPSAGLRSRRRFSAERFAAPQRHHFEVAKGGLRGKKELYRRDIASPNFSYCGALFISRLPIDEPCCERGEPRP
jgi:hypothetical protein